MKRPEAGSRKGILKAPPFEKSKKKIGKKSGRITARQKRPVVRVLGGMLPNKVTGNRLGYTVVKGHFDSITGLTTTTDTHALRSGLGGKADEAQPYAVDVLVTQNHIFQLKPSALGYLENFSAQEIHDLVVPKRTLARRMAHDEPLTVEETDKAVRLARVDKLAARVFGDTTKASRWLRKPKASLGGETPLAYLATEAGARAVEEMLNGIDHGIFA